MHRNRRKRKIVVFSLIFVLLLMVTGYASFSTILTIKGSSKVTSNWDVRITNISKGTFSGSVEEATVDGVKVDPVCSESGTPKTCDTGLKASININLYEVGDSAEYDITISNKGNIDAKLDDVVIDDYGADMFVVSSGDGLYEGDIVTNDLAYVYRGANPNNFIRIGGLSSGEMYRIMGIDTSGNLYYTCEIGAESYDVRPAFYLSSSTSISGSGTSGNPFVAN